MPANQTAFLHLDPDRTVQPNWVTDAYNTLPPGGHIAVLSTPTKYHLNTSRIEVAGFEIRDCVHMDTGPHHFLITITRKPLDGTVLNTLAPCTSTRFESRPQGAGRRTRSCDTQTRANVPTKHPQHGTAHRTAQ